MQNSLSGAKGGGGGFTQKPDTLRSNDTFEGLMGLCAGPIKGPVRGLKSIRVNGTPVEGEDGTANFPNFGAEVADGDPLQFPQIATLKLGAGGSPDQVGANVRNSPLAGGNPWVTHTLNNTGASAVDLRFVVNQLYRQNADGIWPDSLNLEIEMKPIGTTTWINPFMANGNTTPSYSTNGIPQGSGVVFYALKSRWEEALQLPHRANGYYLTIRGKTTSAYVHELRIQVPNQGAYANKGWDVRVRLLERESYDSPEGTKEKYKVSERRMVQWESMTAVYDGQLGDHEDWRGLAWLKVYGKASDNFNGLPEIDGVYDTKIVSVPPASVYDPKTRLYTGTIWDGSWAKAYTDDPAWIIADAISDSISGIAAFVPGARLNKWDALELSKWASELVPDGNGGMHPRYSMNIYVDQPQKVDEFIRFLAGAVGATAWDNGDGEWRLKVDKPEAPSNIFTHENIENEFVYSHTDVDTRFNDVTIVFNNEEFDFREDRVRVQDFADIELHGRKPTRIVAIGCTNRQQALRLGILRLRTNINEKRMVTFQTNRQGKYLERFDHILIADGSLGATIDGANRNSTGRVVAKAPDGLSVTVRDPMRLEVGANYELHFTIPNPGYNPEPTSEPTDPTWDQPSITVKRTVTNTTGQRGDVTVLYLDQAIPADMPENAVVALSAVGLPTLPKAYRVVDVGYDDDGERVSVNAIEIDTGKWAAADNATQTQLDIEKPVYDIPKPLLPADGQMFHLDTYVTEGGARRVLTVRWERPPGRYTTTYNLRYRVNGGPWRLADETAETRLELHYPDAGTYEFEVTANDRRGRVSQPLTGTYELPDVLDIPPAAILTNDSAFIYADADGTATNFSEAVGQLRLSSSTGFITDDVTYSVKAGSATGGVFATIDASGNYAVTALADDLGSVTLVAQYRNFTIEKVFSVTKSRVGADGAPAKGVAVIADLQVVPFTSAGTPVDGAAIIKFTAERKNTTAPVTWSMTKADGTAVSGGVMLSVAGDGLSATLTHGQFDTARGGAEGIIVTVTCDGFSDRTSVVRVQKGATGPTLALTPDKAGFTYVDGVLTPASQTITISAKLEGAPVNASWSTAPNIKSAASSSTFSINAAELGNNSEVVVTATASGVTASFPITKLADSKATHGAPAGTPIAGRPAEDVLYSLDQILVDVDDLQATYGNTASSEQSAAAAAAARDAAQVAEANANQARTDAQAARDAAEQAEADALAQAQAAAGSASTAAGHASTATTKADEAAGSATAASASASTASTKAGEASVSASNAATSASNAGTSANSAASSASVAASSYQSAVKFIGNYNFDTDISGWDGDTQVASWLASESGRNGVLAANGYCHLLGSKKIPVTSASQRFRLRVAMRMSAPNMTTYAGFFMYDANDVLLGATDGSGNYPLILASPGPTSWTTYEAVIGVGQAHGGVGTNAIRADCAYIRPVLFLNYNSVSGGIAYVDFFTVEDITSEIAASGHASAAATSASTASTKASEASTSASSAQTSATNASTSAGTASTQASNASTSAANANTSANNASTSASVAATARDSAQAASKATYPSNFLNPADWLQHNGWGGSVSFSGGIARTVNGGTVTSAWSVPIVSGRTYRFTARHRVVNQGGGVTYFGYINQQDAYHWLVGGQVSATVGTWQTTTFEITAAQILANHPATTSFRPLLLIGYPNTSDGEVSSIVVEDITSEKAAQTSADAAATSASTASTKATEAGQSATAASNSATNASTSAGQAATSASNASTSASQASTSASNAAGSASAASSSATLASNSSTAAKNAALVTFPSTFDTAGSFWTYSGGGETATESGLTVIRNVNGGTYPGIYSKFRPANASGKKWKIRARAKSSSGGGRMLFRVMGYADAATATGGNYVDVLGVVGSTNYVWVEQIVAAPSDPFVEFHLFPNYPDLNAIVTVSHIEVSDVTNEQLAAGSASAAATSASNASTSSTNAGNSASSASTSANSASTSASNAATSASNASTSAANASSSAASATTSMQLAASVTGAAINLDPAFVEFPNGQNYPTRWITADNVNIAAMSRVTGPMGVGYAWRHSPAAGAQCYTAQLLNAGLIQPNSWYVIEVDLKLVAGTLQGAGVYFHDANRTFILPFVTMTNDGGPSIYSNNNSFGVAGRTYRLRQIIKTDNAWNPNNQSYFYIMSHWSGIDSIAAANTIDFYRAAIRPATSFEVDANKIAPLEASVTLNSGVLATLGGKTAAYWQVQTNAGTSGSFITAQAQQTDPRPIALTINENAYGHVAGGEIVWAGPDLKRTGKMGGGVGWYHMAISKESYVGGAYFAFNIGSRADDQIIMAGLIDTPTGNDYESLDYAYYFHASAGGSQVPYQYFYESGVYGGGQPLDWKASDFIEVIYTHDNGGQIVYRRNNVTTRTVTGVGLNRRFYMGASIYYPNSRLNNVVFLDKAPTKNSSVSIGATEFHVYNPAGGSGNEWKKAMSISNGNAIFTGGLQAGAYIRLGNGEGWPVALKPRSFQVSDGEVVSFGTTLDGLPQLSFQRNNLVALNSGETYNVYAENLTTTGFTARCKIITPAAPANYNLTTSTAPGTGPQRQIDKSAQPDATDGNYTISYAGYANCYAYNLGGEPAQ